MHIEEPRQQLDHMLRETRIHLISFSQMADAKANILLSISSVLLSISFTKVADPHFTASITVLVGFLLITIFLALMTVAFGNPGLILPMAIFVVFIAMAFGVSAMWMRMKPDHPQRLTGWSRFRRHGIMTAFGHASAGAATVQVLILPGLVFVWGLAVVTIAAVVR